MCDGDKAQGRMEIPHLEVATESSNEGSKRIQIPLTEYKR